MYYTSTRDKNVRVTSAQAITQGISEDGGLFVPMEFPKLETESFEALSKLSYIERAKWILSLYLTDFTTDEINDCVSNAYRQGKFSSDAVAPLVTLYDNVNILELWKGPTCAFKDMALQLLPYLLTTASSKAVPDKEIVILVATSGDTGKAALEGFKDVKNTKILVFYPNDGVSQMQKLQMTTQEGGNVSVCAIEGNFDDAQTGVKKIFTDRAIAQKLNEKNKMFSSANSINWGRLVPQIVYYISAYCDMISQGKITNGQKINVVVPTGNFGNILAAYYAKKMGLPINKLICASNSNNVLTDFIKTGKYDKNRDFYTTISPSMDILISSNLERLIFDLSSNDDEKVRGFMNDLSKNGAYTVDDDMKKVLNGLFAAGYCNDDETKQTIHDTFFNHGYLSDTHSAVAIKVYEEYNKETNDNTPIVIASTASPFKFPKSVLEAIRQNESNGIDEFDLSLELSKITENEIPVQLSDLKKKQVRFNDVCEKSQMEQKVFDMLGL